MTGSPLLTVCETLPPNSPQHSTSRKSGFLSTQRCASLSKRCAVDATRNLVTLPFAVRLRCGGFTTLPTTVITVSFTVLLDPSLPSGRPAGVPGYREPCGADDHDDSRKTDLWREPPSVDGGLHR